MYFVRPMHERYMHALLMLAICMYAVLMYAMRSYTIGTCMRYVLRMYGHHMHIAH
jgi:hypothetical protein